MFNIVFIIYDCSYFFLCFKGDMLEIDRLFLFHFVGDGREES